MSLFLYDNNILIVQSYRDAPVDVKLSSVKELTKLKDIISGEILTSEPRKPDMHWGKASGEEKNVFSLTIKPHSYRVFKLQRRSWFYVWWGWLMPSLIYFTKGF